MKHAIDPLIDPVFKAIFTKLENRNLLIHFLNAVLAHESPVVEVTIEDPHNQKIRLGDKLTILDIRATDQDGRSFQIEVQVAVHPGLTGRMAFTWAELLTRQLKEGEDYPDLKPAIAIWLMAGTLFKKLPSFHHYLTLSDAHTGALIEKSSGLHVLELPKWAGSVQTELDRWLRFFREGESLDPDHLPEFMRTPEMEQAMSTVRQFSEEEKEYQRYRHARDLRRLQRTISNAHEKAVNEREQAFRDREQAFKDREKAFKEREQADTRADEAQKRATGAEQELDAANAELEKLRRLLHEKGLATDSE